LLQEDNASFVLLICLKLVHALMKKLILLTGFLILLAVVAQATHQRAAEITYRHISGLTYEARIITYTYTPSPADRPELTIGWGDGTSSVLKRTSKINLPDNISFNEYTYDPGQGATTNRHTYSSPGTYVLSMEDPNRNYGVVNIPNSVNVPMYVQTVLVINAFLGYNNSPTLLNPPIDVGCVGQVFIHNPGAYDIDGDSLSYKLVICKTTGGVDIPGFTYPQASNSFSINAYTGDVIWDTPISQGEYNIAFVIQEWRNGVKIGSVTRDMQIEIVACNNTPPVIEPIDDTCVTAGSILRFPVLAYDPDGNKVELTATGGPFEVEDNPASIDPDPASGSDSVETLFTWETNCSHVQKQPYQLFFKAVDDDYPISLVSYKTIQVTVVSPGPDMLTAEPVGNSIRLEWSRVVCEKAAGYYIYRRNGFYGFEPGLCETGVPAYTKYVRIDQVDGILDTNYTDMNGLIQGMEYCYMVTAWFLDGAESYASPETCTQLKKDLPVITTVSNDSTDLFAGRGFISWAKPTELDSVQIPGPFEYRLYRSGNLTGGNMQQIATFPGLLDTVYTDAAINMNTSGTPFSYRVDLESLTFGYVGSSQVASSIFINLTETDQEILLSFAPHVPWHNDYYVIYRKLPGGTTYDSVGTTLLPLFRDTLLTNDQEYCYYVKSVGGYSASGFIDPIINFSQIVCGRPYDNEPPCAPVLSIYTDCDQAINKLTWTNPNHSCADDVVKYYIYYSPAEGSDFTRLDSLFSDTDTTYSHYNQGNITGCYAVTAIDSIGNQSVFSNIVCISNDTCSLYHLPNTFTPNNDLINDFFIPFPYTSVEKIHILIFNRWGTLVYETEDPNINWDGKITGTNQEASDGTYFYTCEVFEVTLEGIKERMIKGSIMLLR
jgi:gliding motility-associated-like protein